MFKSSRPYFEVSALDGVYAIVCNTPMARLINLLIHQQVDPPEKELMALKYALYDALREENDSTGHFRRQRIIKDIRRSVNDYNKHHAVPDVEIVRCIEILESRLRTEIETHNNHQQQQQQQAPEQPV